MFFWFIKKHISFSKLQKNTTIDDNSEFAIFPNPTNGPIQIQFRYPEQIAKVEIIDMQGRIVKDIQRKNYTPNLIVNNYMPLGVYTIKITYANGEFAIEKIIVSNS